MANVRQLGEREREILTAIVDQYIATGEPVGSRTLSRVIPENLSPATVRNVMADLCDGGFLEQPHTSAGRVPTVSAFRYYVEQLRSKSQQISAPEQSMIQGSLSGVADPQDLFERTSHLLSQISHSVGVAIATSGPRHELDHIHFSRLTENKVLAVVVTRSGVVRDRMLRLDSDLSQAELDVAARYINENFRGWTIEDARAELQRRIQQERSEYDRLMKSVAQLYQQGALAADDSAPSVFVEGASNLVVHEQDADRLRQLLKTLEEREKLATLLSAYLDARQEQVRVVIGLEDAAPHLRNFVLIGAPARVGNEVLGSLAVIGPTRMDYEHTITAVAYIAGLIDELMNGPN
jgi:heat-inducible transcriptional repressor